ncbi:MAG TPA: hypothetical protein VGM43_11210 [Bryobacteraceae bacterium]|jgi:hypothetical protein
MSKASKSAWASLTAGLLFLFSAARDIWAPGFLSISSRHPSRTDLTLDFVVAILCLGVACRDLMRMRTAATR